jgi:hypothetical protein
MREIANATSPLSRLPAPRSIAVIGAHDGASEKAGFISLPDGFKVDDVSVKLTTFP